MKKWIFAVIAVIFVSGCSTLHVQVDYDPEYDFKSLSTFSVIYTKKDDTRDLARSRIARSLELFMESKGYKSTKDKNEADFYFVLHLDVQTKKQVETNYINMGINPRLDIYGLPYIYSQTDDTHKQLLSNALEPDMMSTTRTYEYEESKLIIEVLDVENNAVVWQGIAKDEISETYNHEEMSAYINDMIRELFGEFSSK